MKFKLIPNLFVIICLLVLSITSCAQQTAAPKEILVGSPASLTGMFAGFGVHTYGMQAAVDDINNQGGIYVEEYDKKIPLKLIIVDTESDTTKAGTLAEQLIVSDKVNFLAQGGETPVMPPPVSTVADRYKIPFVTAAGPMEPWLAQREQADGKWAYTWAAGFPLVTPYPEGSVWQGQANTVAEMWYAFLNQYGDQTNKKIALFASADSDGMAWYQLFSGILAQWGYDVIGADKSLGLVPMETTDFTSIINEWKAADADILWGNAPAPFAGTLLKQCSAAGYQPKMVAIGRGALFYEDITAWGGDLPNGIIVEIWGDPSISASEGVGGTTLKTLAAQYTEETGNPLNRTIGSGYRSIQVLANAIERAGTLDGEKVNAVLAETNMMTVMGPVKYDENHFTNEPLALGQWQKTSSAEIWDLSVIFSTLDIIDVTATFEFPISYK